MQFTIVTYDKDSNIKNRSLNFQAKFLTKYRNPLGRDESDYDGLAIACWESSLLTIVDNKHGTQNTKQWNVLSFSKPEEVHRTIAYLHISKAYDIFPAEIALDINVSLISSFNIPTNSPNLQKTLDINYIKANTVHANVSSLNATIWTAYG